MMFKGLKTNIQFTFLEELEKKDSVYKFYHLSCMFLFLFRVPGMNISKDPPVQCQGHSGSSFDINFLFI